MPSPSDLQCINTLRFLSVDLSLDDLKQLRQWGSRAPRHPERNSSPLRAEDEKGTRQALRWPLQPAFLVPAVVLDHFRRALAQGEQAHTEFGFTVDNVVRRAQRLLATPKP